MWRVCPSSKVLHAKRNAIIAFIVHYWYDDGFGGEIDGKQTEVMSVTCDTKTQT